MSYATYFFLALTVNLVIEIPIVFVLARYVLKSKIPLQEILFWGTIANLLSLPYLWFIFPLFLPSSSFILIGEIFVVFIEAIIYLKAWKTEWSRALLFSFVANVASYAAGMVLHRIVGAFV